MEIEVDSLSHILCYIQLTSLLYRNTADDMQYPLTSTIYSVISVIELE